MLLLADEPTGNLDSARSAEVLARLWRFHRERGQTTVIVTHNPPLDTRTGQRAGPNPPGNVLRPFPATHINRSKNCGPGRLARLTQERS